MGIVGLALDRLPGEAVSGQADEATRPSPSSSVATAEGRRKIAVWIAGGVALLLGVALRVRGAEGELWLDEIWSLRLVALLRQGQFLIEGLALDNNHYLNTLYLFLIGPDASALALRGFSILLGTAAIPVAGYAMRRAGSSGIVAAMALFSAAYLFVNYGSEARGYAGLILMTLLAIILVESGVERSALSTANRLGIVAVAGFLFQPIMLLSLAILGLWALWLSWRSTRDIRRSVLACLRLFMPALAGLLPLAILIGGAIFRSGEYLIAAKTPFTLAHLLEGYAGLYRKLLGFPDAIPDLVILIVPVLTLLAVHRLLPRSRVSLGLIALVLVPLIVLIVRPPNVQFPRYYLASGIVFLLLLAGLFAEAWRGAAKWRAIAALVALLIAVGNGTEINNLFRYGRGDPLPALRLIAEAQQPVLLNLRDSIVVEHLAQRHGLQVSAVGLAELCAKHPAFMLASDADAPEMVALAQPGCEVTYRREMRTPFWGLSGAPWTLYRAE